MHGLTRTHIVQSTLARQALTCPVVRARSEALTAVQLNVVRLAIAAATIAPAVQAVTATTPRPCGQQEQHRGRNAGTLRAPLLRGGSMGAHGRVPEAPRRRAA